MKAASKRRLVTCLPAHPAPVISKKKTRTAVYCRVSTAEKGQLASLENQKRHFKQLIESRESWTEAGFYCDAGLSGTGKVARPALERLLKDCREGKVDLVLTKSISRLARNTSDTLTIVRELSALGIPVYFERERLHTGDCGGELLLTLLAALAEQESKSISENVRWRFEKRCRRGIFRFSRPPYGYQLEDGMLYPDPEEAAVIREICAKLIAGKGTCVIANELNAARVPTKRGGRWHGDTIRRMLKNVLLQGDLQLNMHDHSCCYIREHHEPVLSRELFRAVGEALAAKQKPRSIPSAPNSFE